MKIYYLFMTLAFHIYILWNDIQKDFEQTKELEKYKILYFKNVWLKLMIKIAIYDYLHLSFIFAEILIKLSLKEIKNLIL